VAQAIHAADLKAGFGRVSLPYALSVKYPKADREWAWQYVFPSTKLSNDPRSGDTKRHHLFDSYMEDAVKQATIKVGLSKRITCHTLIYTHVARSPVPRVVSPLDEL
jgi:hypothetical protein